MDEQSSRQLHRSSLTAVFLSGGALLALTISMPILCTMVNQLEEDINVARKNYDEMSNFMWRDLREQDKHIREPRQTYKEGAAPVPEGGGGGTSGGRTCSAESCVSLSCPAGEPGPKGADGQPGPNGMDGVPGKNGVSANGGDSYIQGAAAGGCPPCPAGPPGAPGYRGKKGPRGPKGEKGPAGNPGRDGEPGDEGTEGDVGRPGKIGEPGPRGPPGESGMGFSKGAMGARGPMGPVGPEGDEGLPGERGEDAAPGSMGPPGPPGPPGEPGADGIPGSPGKSGGHGADANYCPCPARKEEAEVVSGGATKDKYVAPAGETVSGASLPPPAENSYKNEESAPEIPAAPTGEVSSPAKETAAAPEATAAPTPSRASESYKAGEGQAYREPINKAAFAKQLRRKLVLL